MEWRKFTFYSTAGGALFNTALAYSTYAAKTNPNVIAQLQDFRSYASTRWPVITILVVLLIAASYLLYTRRRQYAEAPHYAVRHIANTTGIVALAVGVSL